VPVVVSIARPKLKSSVVLTLVVTDETNGITREQPVPFLAGAQPK
jgi:hypothetical protein